MRGLTADEAEALRGRGEIIEGPAIALAERLVARGLFAARKGFMHGMEGTIYSTTDLGRLALRVATALPKVTP